ncbi:MAG: GatB/YqeY domain-containing protein [Bacteroidota bacterium]
MSLKTTIENSIKDAMRAKDAGRLMALRSIKSLIMVDETSGKFPNGLTAEDDMKVLMKAAKQRKDAAEMFQGQNRTDLYEKEMSELAVIEEFLPKQLSPDEIKAKVAAIIAKVGATSIADLGKVMGVASKEMAGLADGKAISGVVRELLS